MPANADITESYERLWNRALWYLGRRDYGAQELQQKLARPRPNKPKPVPEDIDKAIKRLQELGLLNDERYAQRLAESLSNKGFGERGIKQELRMRGLADEAPEIEIEDSERLAQLLQTPKFQRKLEDERGRRSLYQALLRKGFKHGDIRTAMRDYMEEEQYDGTD